MVDRQDGAIGATQRKGMFATLPKSRATSLPRSIALPKCWQFRRTSQTSPSRCKHPMLKRNPQLPSNWLWAAECPLRSVGRWVSHETSLQNQLPFLLPFPAFPSACKSPPSLKLCCRQEAICYSPSSLLSSSSSSSASSSPSRWVGM